MGEFTKRRRMMSREEKKTFFLTTLVCLLPIIAGALLYNRLPDQMATHWDFGGNANGWESKNVAVFVFPGILLVINMIFPFLLKVDPRYKNYSEKVKALLYWIIPVVELFASSGTIAIGLGVNLNIAYYSQIFVGLLFTIIGNYLPKMAQSYTVGIKLPWTLDDEENWNKTHRMAGFLWVVCGLLMMISVALPIRWYCCIALGVIMVLVPTIYSYVLYSKKKK